MPGKARFHGNGMGGGAEASRRTASMTEEVKPDDGRTSSWAPRMRSISGSFIVPPSRVVTSDIRPPSSVAQPGTAEAWCAEFPVRETSAPRSEEHTSELQSLRHLV